MLDDLRNHDPAPTEEEREWTEFDPFTLGVAAMAVLGLMIGVYASLLQDPPMRATTIAETRR